MKLAWKNGLRGGVRRLRRVVFGRKRKKTAVGFHARWQLRRLLLNRILRPVPAPEPYVCRRLVDKPIVSAESDPVLAGNVNGPSLIRVPGWLPDPLGRYYLYFAHHKGQFIRLAYANDLAGPWQVYELGTLHLNESTCHDHVASPDVHVDDENREIRMYFHGPSMSKEEAAQDRQRQRIPLLSGQRTKVALSRDGLSFRALPEILGPSYFRVFRHKGWWYALAMPGLFLRSRDGLSDWETGPVRFDHSMRHSALRVVGDRLEIFYTRVGDCPERILLSTVSLNSDWSRWRESKPVEILRPESRWEGSDLPLEPSRRGRAPTRVHQVRDPGIYEENGQLYLLYSVAGEQGLGIASLSQLRVQDPVSN